MTVFVDSNIPMYVAGKDHPLKDPSRRFLEKVQAEKIEACTSTEVLQEILYRYVGLNRRQLAIEVYELFAQLCPRILPVTIADTDRAKAIIRDRKNVGVRDAIHAAVALNNGVADIVTFDKGFDDIPSVVRIEPE